MNRLISTFLLSALFAPGATFTGVITESMCKDNHQAMKMGKDPDCIRHCVEADKNVKYVLFDGQKTYKLSDQQTPHKFAGQRVKITGTLYEKTGVLDVQQIQPVR